MWIYARFRQGLLGGYNSDEIQAAIWKLEGEWSATVGHSDFLIAQAYAAVASGESGAGVKVLNLFTRSGSPAQDQLTLQAVPEPASLLLFGIGLLSVARLPRRRA